MKNKFTIITVALAIFALGTSEVIFTEGVHGDGTRFPGGITGRTGANGGPTCTACHGGNLNTGKGYIYITTDIPNFKYQLGKEYNIAVTINDSNAVKYGLDFTALKSGDTLQLGTLIAGSSTRVSKGEITHKEPSASKTFNFKWKAPATPAGTGAASNITFYVAGLAANGDGHNTGDLVYATNRVITLEKSGIPEINEPVTNVSIYPNPAADFINVSYTLRKSESVTVKLLSLTGKVVQNLFTETQQAGLQSKVLQLPETISSGVYLLNVQAEGANVINKLVIKK